MKLRTRISLSVPFKTYAIFSVLHPKNEVIQWQECLTEVSPPPTVCFAEQLYIKHIDRVWMICAFMFGRSVETSWPQDSVTSRAFHPQITQHFQFFCAPLCLLREAINESTSSHQTQSFIWIPKRFFFLSVGILFLSSFWMTARKWVGYFCLSLRFFWLPLALTAYVTFFTLLFEKKRGKKQWNVLSSSVIEMHNAISSVLSSCYICQHVQWKC